MPFTSTLDPVLLHLGPIEIRYYGLVYAFGFLLALVVLQYARNHKILNLTKDEIYDFVFYLMVGVVLGARLLHILSALPYYLSHPLSIIAVWEGGMAFYGGLLGAFVSSYLFCRKKGQNLLLFADILSPLAAVMLGFGRIANFINGELYGTVTNVSWCVNFPGVEGCRHPYQLYSSLAFLLIFGILLLLKSVQQRKHYAIGFLFWTFVLLASLSRFVIDFWRDGQRLFGLDFAQYISIIVLCCMFLYRKRIFCKATLRAA